MACWRIYLWGINSRPSRKSAVFLIEMSRILAFVKKLSFEVNPAQVSELKTRKRKIAIKNFAILPPYQNLWCGGLQTGDLPARQGRGQFLRRALPLSPSGGGQGEDTVRNKNCPITKYGNPR